ncbi:MAG: 3-polyprenyl-4-hydroxybenzoate decarboxylase [Verrucomicrobiaceae bacterium]|nr:3-polyprenyl-4-hydroxybenzoate decarboxylase [Verrucomicrobiaceae bacterium]
MRASNEKSEQPDMTQPEQFTRTITLAITGASGAQYGLRLLDCLLAANCRVYLLISNAAQIVLATETDVALPAFSEWADYFQQRFSPAPGQLKLFSRDDWFAPVASGSSAPSSMVICPCSTGSLSAIAHGASNNLIERAADVALKERRQLILVPRETPYSQIHLQNMLTLTQMGAIILPASPGFYQRPTQVAQLVDFIVARILDQLGVAQQLMARWGEPTVKEL